MDIIFGAIPTASDPRVVPSLTHCLDDASPLYQHFRGIGLRFLMCPICNKVYVVEDRRRMNRRRKEQNG